MGSPLFSLVRFVTRELLIEFNVYCEWKLASALFPTQNSDGRTYIGYSPEYLPILSAVIFHARNAK